MKTLATCSPREFLVQTNKIRKAAAEWLSATEIMKIWKSLPELPKDAAKEEKNALLKEQFHKNIGTILDKVLEEYPDMTAEVLGLCCFVEPAELNDHKMFEFLGAFADIINCPEVISFFISLMNLGNQNISVYAKQ